MRLEVAVIVALVGIPAVAYAGPPNPHLQVAREQKAALRYADALQVLGAALEWGKNDPGQLAEIHRLGGELAAGLGRDAEAIAHFERLLVLNPNETLPPGTSPKIAAPFEQARARARERGPLAVHHEVVDTTLALVVDADPLDMVTGARVRYGAPGGEVAIIDAHGRGRIAFALPPAPMLHTTVAALDEHGNELVIIGTRNDPIRVAQAPAPQPKPDPPLTALPPPQVDDAGHPVWPYAAGVTTVALGGAIYFALDMRDAEDELATLRDQSMIRSGMPPASEAQDLIDRGDRSELLANIGYATAAVGAAATLWLLLQDDDEAPVGVAVTPSGASIVGRF